MFEPQLAARSVVHAIMPIRAKRGEGYICLLVVEQRKNYGDNMSILGFFKGNGKSGFGYNSTTTDVTAGLDLSDRTILVTGCNAGLGQESLCALCARGARVIGAARTLDKAAAACALVSGKALPVACDLSEPASVRAAVDGVKQMGYALDAIIANAGIMAS